MQENNSELYLCGDCRFFDDTAAQEFNVSIEQYNDHVIECWNNVIQPNDNALVLGIFSKGNLEQTKKLCSKLNGRIKILDVNNSNFSKEDWDSIGITTFQANGWLKGKIQDIEENVFIITNKEDYDKFSNEFKAVVGSLNNQTEIYKNKTLNLSLKNWSFSPIKYNSLAILIDNQILFNSMEE